MKTPEYCIVITTTDSQEKAEKLVGAKLGKPWHKITKETSSKYLKRFPNHHWKNNC